MFDRILVPLDGSPLAERALPFAKALAYAGAGRIVLVRAEPAPKEHEVAVGPERVWVGTGAQDYLAGAAIGLQGVPVESALVFGSPETAVLRAAADQQADVVVLSTHGRSGLGRWLYGSVADHVLRHATTPVLLIPAGCQYRWDEVRKDAPPRVLVPLDGSAFAEAALPAACQLAAVLGAELDVVRAVELPSSSWYAHAAAQNHPPEVVALKQAEATEYVEAVASRLRAEGHHVTAHTEVGWPPTVITNLARERRSRAIAMATHGRSGLARAVLGSVATETLQLAGTPLLLVRPTNLHESDTSSRAQRV